MGLLEHHFFARPADRADRARASLSKRLYRQKRFFFVLLFLLFIYFRGAGAIFFSGGKKFNFGCLPLKGIRRKKIQPKIGWLSRCLPYDVANR